MRQDSDVREKVEDALLDEQVHVLIGLPLPCHAVHLKRHPYGLDDRENAHHCTMRDL